MLLFADSFDHYATADLFKKWTGSLNGDSNYEVSNALGRRASGALRCYYSTQVVKTLPARGALVVGAAVRVQRLESNRQLFCVSSGGIRVGAVFTNLDGTLSVVRFNDTNGTATVLAVSAAVIPAGSYHYIELKWVASATEGSFELRVNGVSQASASNINTAAVGGGTLNGIGLGNYSSFNGSDVYFDDVYVCDMLGGANNNFLGDVRVDALMPDGDGYYQDFTPTTAGTHYTMVDEDLVNAGDFVDSSVVGQRDSYAFEALVPTSAANVFGVVVSAAIQKDDSGTRLAATFARLSSTDAFSNLDGSGTGLALSTSQLFYTQAYDSKPGGGSWTVTDVNNAEFGITVTA